MVVEGEKKEGHKFLGEHAAADAAKSLQSCPTLCDPINGSPPGSSISGILQVRISEWVSISFSARRTQEISFPRK